MRISKGTGSEERDLGPKGFRTRMSEAVALTGLPVATALVAFAYEVGAAVWFGVPVAMIQLTWTNITLALFALSSLLLFLLTTGYLVAAVRIEATLFTPKRIMGWTPFVVGSAIVTFQHGLTSPFALVCAGVLSLLAALDLITNWLNRVAIRRGKRLVDEDYNPLRHPVNRLALTSFWVIAALGVAFSTGYANSKGSTRFLVSEEESPRVLVRSYGSTMVLAPLQETRREFGPTIQFVSIGTEPGLFFTWRSLGTLTRAESMRRERPL